MPHQSKRIVLAILLSLFLWPSTLSAEPKLYALMVFDTHADTIGSHKIIDRDNMTRVLFKSFDQSGRRHRLEWKVLDGYEATPERVLKYYVDLVSTTEDTLLFYYGGHGGVDRDGNHYLAMKHDDLSRSLLRGAINFQKHNLAIIITDCCANFPDQRPFEEPEFGEGANWDTAKQLFFGSSGMVDVNSAKVGSFSYTSPTVGGLYTASLAYKMCRKPTEISTSGDVTWSKFLGAVDDRVEHEYNMPQEKQFSVAFYINQNPTQRWEKYVRFTNNSDKYMKVEIEYRAVNANNQFEWIYPSRAHLVWNSAPGNTFFFVDRDFKVRADQIKVWAATPDGTWRWPGTKGQAYVYNTTDSRFGYAGGDIEYFDVGFK